MVKNEQMLAVAHLSRGSRVLLGALLGVVALLLAPSCTDQLPAERPVPTPPSVAPEWGLDARPVSQTCIAVAKPELPAAPTSLVAYEPLATGLTTSVEIVSQGGRIYVVDSRGIIRIIGGNGSLPVVLDISARVEFGYDAGLVSLAFHPKFAENGYVYLAYTVPYPTQPPPAGVVFQSVLGRFQSKDGGLTIDPTTEKRILVRDQPAANHQGNKLVFDKSGLLYFAVGEGTLAPRAQDTNQLFGKILRIDIDKGDPYAIPPGNPFAQGGGAPEVYAYGFRNPWRISFDSLTGDLWAADVGQEAFEEVDRVIAGGNYGWPILEGNTCNGAPTCNRSGLIAPLVVHSSKEAEAIIGGFVYRGTAFPSLVGKYVYADFTYSTFWAVDPSAPVPIRLNDGLPRLNPTSIGVDEKGELLFLSSSAAFRIVPAPPVVPETPAKLSATGCVDTVDPSKPTAGLFRYDVNAPQWMDGAVAERFLSVPATANIVVQPGARFELPVGSVAMRTLQREGRRVETQFLLRRPDASWSAYTYAWSADQKDAVLATANVSIGLPSGAVHEVRPQDCATCHDAHQSGQPTPLALDAAQLDRPMVEYAPGRSGNPLVTLEHVGMLNAPVLPETYVALPSPTGYDTPERRSRAYLHANCAFCHDGAAPSGIDLRSWIPLRDTKTCGVNGAGTTGGTLRLAPGNPDGSQILTSLRATGAGRMPPVGTAVVDRAATELLSSWILSTPACP